jgi:1-acyl-sn-glycerol-3-phosphate acyltransferase
MKMAVNDTYTHYDHASYQYKRRFLRFLIKHIGFTLLAKLDRVDDMDNVPSQGSAILLINHIAFIDPIVVLHVLPRNIVPLAKIEVYDYPLIGIFPKMWGVVPIKREDIDRRAIQKAMAILRAGEIVLVAPEGTRHHELQEAREGIAYLSSRTGSPIIPVAIDGTEGFPALRWTAAWKTPGAHLRFGKPFRFRADLNRARGRELRLMTDEAMYILASLLPECRRGIYADLTKATQETIEWVK